MPNTPEQQEHIRTLLLILKKTSSMYKVANNSQKEQIFEKFLHYVDDLVELGYQRDFAESLLMFGAEFLKVPSMINSEHYRKLFPEAYEVFL